jgi:hypothetical protein
MKSLAEPGTELVVIIDELDTIGAHDGVSGRHLKVACLAPGLDPDMDQTSRILVTGVERIQPGSIYVIRATDLINTGNHRVWEVVK